MSGLEGRFLSLIKNLEEEKRLADKRAKQLYDLADRENRPCFLVSNTVTRSNVTGDGTYYPIPFDNERFDRGANFASDTFTASVTGQYYFTAAIRIDDLSSGTFEDLFIQLITSNESYRSGFASGLASAVYAGAIKSLCISTLADMDVNDTAFIRIYVKGGGKTVDVRGEAVTMETFFSGALIC